MYIDVLKHIHKINGLIGKVSLSVVLPRNFLKDLGIVKGDFVEIDKEKDQILIKKLKAEKKSNRINNDILENDTKRDKLYNDINNNIKGPIENENEKVTPVDRSFDAQSTGINC